MDSIGVHRQNIFKSWTGLLLRGCGRGSLWRSSTASLGGNATCQKKTGDEEEADAAEDVHDFITNALLLLARSRPTARIVRQAINKSKTNLPANDICFTLEDISNCEPNGGNVDGNR